MKKYYQIVWSVAKKLRVKTPNLQWKKRRRILSPKSTLCARKKLRFVKEKEALVRLFGLLGVKGLNHRLKEFLHWVILINGVKWTK